MPHSQETKTTTTKRSNIVTNSTKILKMAHIKKNLFQKYQVLLQSKMFTFVWLNLSVFAFVYLALVPGLTLYLILNPEKVLLFYYKSLRILH